LGEAQNSERCQYEQSPLGGAQYQQADGLSAERMAAMSAYTATATREGLWWVINVDGIGVTQSRTLAEAHTWAQGLIEAVTGKVGADVTVTPSLPDGTVDRVRDAQALAANDLPSRSSLHRA
jgi:hypothetical protein